MKNSLTVGLVFLSCALYPHLASATDPNGNHIKIIYLDEEVFFDGGVHQHNEIREFLYDINAEIIALENEARVALTQEISQTLPSSFDLDGVGFGVNNYIDLELESLGGGEFELNFLGLAPHVVVYVELSAAPWLLDGSIRLNFSHLHATGSYDLYTGNASAVLNPPTFTIDVDYGGLGAAFINFITFGGLDDIVDDVENELRQEINESIDDIVNQRLNTVSASLFGIEPNIPNNLYHHGIDVAQEIRDLLDDIPAGTVVGAQYVEIATKYHSKFTLSLGNNIVIELTHRNPNGLCTGRCRR